MSRRRSECPTQTPSACPLRIVGSDRGELDALDIADRFVDRLLGNPRSSDQPEPNHARRTLATAHRRRRQRSLRMANLARRRCSWLVGFAMPAPRADDRDVSEAWPLLRVVGVASASIDRSWADDGGRCRHPARSPHVRDRVRTGGRARLLGLRRRWRPVQVAGSQANTTGPGTRRAVPRRPGGRRAHGQRRVLRMAVRTADTRRSRTRRHARALAGIARRRSVHARGGASRGLGVGGVVVSIRGEQARPGFGRGRRLG